MSTHHDDKRRRGQQEGGHPGGDEGDLGVTGGAQRLAEKRVGDDEIPENRQQALFTLLSCPPTHQSAVHMFRQKTRLQFM